MLMSLALGLQPADQILFQQREEHDARRLLDLVEHAVELLLAAHQRIDMFDRASRWRIARPPRAPP